MSGMYRYWSNGTEGYAWQALWCERCEKDHHASHYPEADPGTGCDVLLRTYLTEDHRTIPELVESDSPYPRPVDQGVVCLAFVACRWCDPDEDDPPEPVVPIPGQFTIFDFTLAETPA